jgi:hypothetical protein
MVSEAAFVLDWIVVAAVEATVFTKVAPDVLAALP